MKIFRLMREYIKQKMHLFTKFFMKQKKKSYIKAILFFGIMFLIVIFSCIYGSNEQHSLDYQTYQLWNTPIFFGYIFIIFSIILIPIGLIYIIIELKEKKVNFDNGHEKLTKRLDEHIKWMNEKLKKNLKKKI